MSILFNKTAMVDQKNALPGRDKPIDTSENHYVLGRKLQPPYDDSLVCCLVGLGCFWGAEKAFWNLEGVNITAVGYSAGYTPNPTYDEVCSGLTGHNEVVLVVFDPAVLSYESLLHVFWESHDPTQGMRQGNDRGSQYRSGIYVFNDKQKEAALATKELAQKALSKIGKGDITTEIQNTDEFYFAEGYHQQYLAKNPNGYCGLGGTGICISGAK